MARYSQQFAQVSPALVAWAKSLIGESSTATVKLQDDRFHERKFTYDTSLVYPCALFTPAAERLTPRTNRGNSYGHGIKISLCSQKNRTLSIDDGDEIIYWRELLIEAMSDERIPTLLPVWCQIEPDVYFDPTAFASGVDATAFVVRASRTYVRP